MSNRNNIIEVVKQDLGFKNLSPNIIEGTPSLVRRAVIKLQKRQVLPPKRFEFLSKTEKQEKRDSNEELMYYYYTLPSDFRTLDEFYVRDDQESTPLTVKPYSFTSYDNYMSNYQTLAEQNSGTQMKLFTITDLNDKKILIASPFPADTKHVEIKYYPDGVGSTLDEYTEGHWEAIIEQVHIILGIKDPQDEENTLDEASAWKNQKGNKRINSTHTKKSASSIFSGNRSSYDRNKKRRR